MDFVKDTHSVFGPELNKVDIDYDHKTMSFGAIPRKHGSNGC